MRKVSGRPTSGKGVVPVHDVYEDIRAERARQVAKGRDAAHDDKRTIGDWYACLSAVVQKDGASEREIWVKVGSIAVAAVEAIDRSPQCPCGHDNDEPSSCILASGCGVATPPRCICSRPFASHPHPRCDGYIPVGGRTCPSCSIATYRHDGVEWCTDHEPECGFIHADLTCTLTKDHAGRHCPECTGNMCERHEVRS